MIKQNKGKDLHKIAKSKLIDRDYYASTKFDGFYVQIHYDHAFKRVKFFTSGGKPFKLAYMAAAIKLHCTESFKVECEYNHGCLGKLGDRGKSAMTTTYRTEFEKGIMSTGNGSVDIFRPFDLLDMPNTRFEDRLSRLIAIFYGFKKWFVVPTQEKVGSLAEAKALMEIKYSKGYEGIMLKSPDHIYQAGKRSNDIIKMKPRKTADLICRDWKEGTGKYEGMTGSLLLEDENHIHVWVGSGMSDEMRSKNPEQYIGKVFEIGYESFKDTYIQPILKHIRRDKETL